MKRGTKITLGLGSVAAAGLALAYGPLVVGGLRFEHALGAIAEERSASVGKWPRMAEQCELCHGRLGNSANARFPSLAGLDAGYLERQLQDFAEHRRTNASMESLAGSLGPNVRRDLAQMFASQATVRNPDLPAPADGRGAQLTASLGCASCHGEGLVGTGTAPRLAGQGHLYLAAQLGAFKAGHRRDPAGAMSAVAARIEDRDIAAISAYASGLNPAGRARPQ